MCHASKMDTLLKHREDCPSLQIIIKIGGGDIAEGEREKFEQMKLYTLKEVEVCTQTQSLLNHKLTTL